MDSPFLLIAGSAKSGTSSLFRYLADHPDVCGSSPKETYFYAPEFDSHDITGDEASFDDFLGHFKHASSPSQLRVEATPFTMYAEGAAERIANDLPDARVLFLVRDPITRFISDYRFLKQRDQLGEPAPTARQFADAQLADPDALQTTLGLGHYMDVIPSFAAALGSENIEVVFFEELRDEPVATMARISEHYGLTPGFYDDYSFQVINKTIAVGNPLINSARMRLEPIVRSIRDRVLSHEKLHRGFERGVDIARIGMEKLSESNAEQEPPTPDDVIVDLGEHYRSWNDALAAHVGRELPSSWMPTPHS